MSAPEPAPDLEAALALFRKEWLEEAERKRNEARSASTAAEPPQASASSALPIAPPARSIGAGLEELRIEEEAQPARVRSAVEEYQSAVDAEREGRLNDGASR